MLAEDWYASEEEGYTVMNASRMKRSDTCAIAIMARDCGSALARNIPEVERLASCFHKAIIVCVENDSRDNTKEILQRWKDNSSYPIHILTFDYNNSSSIRTGSSMSRIERMAYYRNQYMDFLATYPEAFDDLIIIDIDVDQFSANTVMEGILHAPDGWAAIFSNGRFYTKLLNRTFWGKYYDTYAYVPADCPQEEMNYSEVKIANDHLLDYLKREEYVPCKSAFGGIGVYQWQAAKRARYSADSNNRSTYYSSLSEHVPFNKCVREHGGLYISQKMLVKYTKVNPFMLLLSLLNRQERTLKIMKRLGIHISE